MNMDLVERYLWLNENADEDALFLICQEPDNDEEKFAAACLLMTFPSNERKAE